MVLENVGFSLRVLWARDIGLEGLLGGSTSGRMAGSIVVAAMRCGRTSGIVARLRRTCRRRKHNDT